MADKVGIMTHMNNEIVETFKSLSAVTEVNYTGFPSTYEVKARSMLSSEEHTMVLPIDLDEISSYNNGALLQNAFPRLNAAEREFIKTGITEQEWDSLFADE